MAGENDAERLVVLLEARIRDFEKNMQKASGTADKSYGRMRKGSRSATRQMEQDITRANQRINQAVASTSTQIGALGRTFAAGFAGGVFAGGISGLAAGIRNIVRETASLNDEAARAGLSLKVFQEWKAVAEDTRIPLDAMVDTFKELNIRADEFATTGKGSAADAFARLGMSPAEVQRRLKDPSDLMLELIRRTKALKDTAAAARIFDELFGGTGAEQAVRLLQLADGEIQNIITSAHESGRILDEEMVQRAAEIDREFNTLWRNFESGAKAAILNVSIALRDGLFNDIANMGQALRDMANDPSLHNAARFLFGENTQIGDELAPMRGMEARVKKLQDTIAKNRDLGFDALEAERELAIAQAALEAEVHRIMSGQGRGTIGPTGETTLPTITVTPTVPPAGGGGRSRRERADAANREMEAVNALIDSLAHELSLIGQSDLAQAQLNARRQAGASATEGQLSQIDMLVEAIYREKEAHEQAAQAAQARTQALENVFQMAGDGLLSVMDGSVKAEDAVKKLAVQLALAAAQAALLGTGPLAGLFGGGGASAGGGGFLGGLLGFIPKLFGFSQGTANTGGQRGQPRGIVHGQEAVIPLPDGGKVPVQLQGGGNGGGSSASPQGVAVDVRVSVDKDGNLQAFVDNIAQQRAGQAFNRGMENFWRSPQSASVVADRMRKAHQYGY